MPKTRVRVRLRARSLPPNRDELGLRVAVLSSGPAGERGDRQCVCLPLGTQHAPMGSQVGVACWCA